MAKKQISYDELLDQWKATQTAFLAFMKTESEEIKKIREQLTNLRSESADQTNRMINRIESIRASINSTKKEKKLQDAIRLVLKAYFTNKEK